MITLFHLGCHSYKLQNVIKERSKFKDMSVRHLMNMAAMDGFAVIKTKQAILNWTAQLIVCLKCFQIMKSQCIF